MGKAEVLRGLDWLRWGRPDQVPPEGDWRTWLFMGGRGAGKTRAGAEWVNGLALGAPFACPPDADGVSHPCPRIALVGETMADAREVMLEGESGLMNIRSGPVPRYEASRRRVVWPNGSVAQLFSAEDPESLRGPQFGAAWCDEVGKWRRAEEVWDMLQFGLRLGERPRTLVTTTPRAVPLIRMLLADEGTRLTRAATNDNAENLSPAFLKTVEARYAGTRLGRQELDGELIEDRDDGLFSREQIEAGRVAERPERMSRIVVAVDPPASSGPRADACGIVLAGEGEDGTFYVLADHTIERATPMAWAEKAVDLYQNAGADALVAEVNQGGEMVAAVLAQADASIPVRMVRATRGKWLRAEPIALLYEKGRVRHVGTMRKLEDEMCAFGPDGLANGRSPDRLDALVWALTALSEGRRAQPRIRPL
ncbi:MAG: terminase family protein [Pseudomonadota bacterium]